MKTAIIFSIVVVLSSPIAYSQTNEAPDGAAGVKFGMSLAQVKSIWNTKGTIYQDYTVTIPKIGIVFYKNLKVGTKTFDMASASFVNNKLYMIELSLFPESDVFAQLEYDNLKEVIESKYGKGRSIRRFNGIYEDGDGYEMQAIRVGQGRIVTQWSFEPVSIVKLEIKPLSENVYVSLGYISVSLGEEADKLKEQKNVIEF